ncbi:MAG: sigma-70 factor domain-containing protein, partial [Bdellovibrionota bacterium]|nr:sigma-70 factor domain-containing protein [Bdellovibrionota bacterium]
MSLVEEFLNSKTFSKLLIKGKDQKFITPEEINDAIPVSIVSQAELDLIMINIKESRIDVKAQVSEEDDEGIKLDGTEIIEETLSKEERAELKSASTDPVKLYLKRMGSVALLTREGEVVIAKDIEEGEREIILSSLSSTHALKEIIKLKSKIENSENPHETVKELVRGLDDESSQADIKKTKDKITAVIEKIKDILNESVCDDGTFKPLTESQKKSFQGTAETLADLTFNRKVINSFVDPVKKYYHQFKELYGQENRIFKFLEVQN